MPEVPQRPPEGQAPDVATARRRLGGFIEAGRAFMESWDPSFERGRNPPYVAWIDDLLRMLPHWEEELAETAEIAAWMAAPLDLGDLEQVRRWLQALGTQVEDVVAAGEDATRPLGQRALGRPLARKQIMEARRALRGLIDAAEKGIDPPRSG